MRVSYNYLPKQFANPEPILDEIRELIKTGDFTLGRQVSEFEGKFASLIGTKYALGVGSGTDAIKLSLKACGVGPGDEVITAANTFVATVGAIVEIGAEPVFIDVNSAYVLDPTEIERAISFKTKAIVPVHFTGEPVEMDSVLDIARCYGLVVVEDACQSILAKYNGQNCGSFGEAGAFSLHPLKNLNVWSDGGMITTNNKVVYEKLKLLRNHGLKNRDEVQIFGYNSRLDTIQAIVGNHLIGRAHEITKQRQENARYYDQRLCEIEDISLPPKRPGCEPVYHLYMFRVPKGTRGDLVRHLNKHDVEAKVHYPIPIYRQEAARPYFKGPMIWTDFQAESVVSLPVDQHVTRDEQDYVISRIKEYFG